MWIVTGNIYICDTTTATTAAAAAAAKRTGKSIQRKISSVFERTRPGILIFSLLLIEPITSLPGVIICKALGASFGKKRRYIIIRAAHYICIIIATPALI